MKGEVTSLLLALLGISAVVGTVLTVSDNEGNNVTIITYNVSDNISLEHNNLSGLQGGTNGEYYHLDSEAYNYLKDQDQEVTTTSNVTFNNIYLSLDNCDTLDTDSNGKIICGVDEVNDADSDPTNEIQDLQSVTDQGSTTSNSITAPSITLNSWPEVTTSNLGYIWYTGNSGDSYYIYKGYSGTGLFRIKGSEGLVPFEVDVQNGYVDIPTHDGATKGLKLGGNLVTVSASELNQLEGLDQHLTTSSDVTFNTVSANKFSGDYATLTNNVTTYKIHLTSNNVDLTSSGGYHLKISSPSGYVTIGAENSGWAHFFTDRPRYYFDKGITANTGQIGSYDEDLYLQRAGTTKLTVGDSMSDFSTDVSVEGFLNTSGYIKSGGTVISNGNVYRFSSNSDRDEISLENNGLKMSYWGNIDAIIDADGNDGSRAFNIWHDANDVTSASKLFYVNENGNMWTSGSYTSNGNIYDNGGTMSVGVDGSKSGLLNLYSDNSAEAGEIVFHGGTAATSISTTDWHFDRYNNDIRMFYGSDVFLRLYGSTGNVDIGKSGTGTTYIKNYLHPQSNVYIDNGKIMYFGGSSGSTQSALYTTTSSNRLFVRAEGTDNIAQFASYGLYLPRTSTTNLYLGGSMVVDYGNTGSPIYFGSAKSKYIKYDSIDDYFYHNKGVAGKSIVNTDDSTYWVWDGVYDWTYYETDSDFRTDIYAVNGYIGKGVSFPGGTYQTSGVYGRLAKYVAIPSSGSYKVMAVVQDSYDGSTTGYWFAQIGVDSTVIAEEDIGGSGIHTLQGTVSLTSGTHLFWYRLYLKKTISSYGVTTVVDKFAISQQ